MSICGGLSTVVIEKLIPYFSSSQKKKRIPNIGNIGHVRAGSSDRRNIISSDFCTQVFEELEYEIWLSLPTNEQRDGFFHFSFILPKVHLTFRGGSLHQPCDPD